MHGKTERSARSTRWALMGRHWVRVDDRPFLGRLQIVQTPWFSILLTKLHSADIGRDPHDHSRWFCSWIITGGYNEFVYMDPHALDNRCYRQHRRWSWHVMHPEHAHSITRVHKPLWTLVLAGKQRGTWSFWTPRGQVDWKLYGAIEREGEPD